MRRGGRRRRDSEREKEGVCVSECVCWREREGVTFNESAGWKDRLTESARMESEIWNDCNRACTKKTQTC